jgi:translation initiation factor IF-2
VGDTLSVVADEKQARAQVEQQQQQEKAAARAVSLTNILDQIDAGQVKELNIVLKADVQGSIEPIKTSLEKLSTDKVKVSIIHSSSGNITESDVMLAIASKGLIIAFNTKVDTGAQRLAETEGIDIRHYDIIYNLIDDVEKALKGLLEPEVVEVIDGRAEVRAVFPSSKKKSIAGCYVTEGKVVRGAAARVKRGDKVVAESTVESLRRFKDDVKDVAAGYECGIALKGVNDFQPGDILEFYSRRKSA